MTSERKTWDSVKAEYLRQVEKALSSVRHPRSKEVLEDVRSHLDRRFAELEPEQQSWENFQAIITEMGPASDYAELLTPDAAQTALCGRRKYLLWFGLAAVVIIAATILLPTLISPKVGYIISFKPVKPFEPQTARELLSAFNENHPRGVRTHHFRTRIRSHKLEGLICVDNKTAKNAIVNMIDKSDKLKLIGVRAVTQKELESHYRLGQPSVRTEGTRDVPAALQGTWERIELLDHNTRQDLITYENYYRQHYEIATDYESASARQKAEMVEQWMRVVQSSDYDKAVKAAVALNEVRSQKAAGILAKVATDRKGSNRVKWIAVRGLAKMGLPEAVPALITLLDHHNKNVRTYAKVGLAEISGCFFGDDKPRWCEWAREQGIDVSQVDTSRKESGYYERGRTYPNRPEAQQERKLIRELQGALEEWVKNNSQAIAEKCDLLIEQIITQPKPSAKAYFTAAMAANSLGQPQKAILMLKKAIAEHPNEHAGGLAMPVKVTGYYRIGAIARQIGDADGATKAYEDIIKNIQGLEAEEFHRAICYMYLAEIASEILKDKQLAAKQIQEAIATIDATDMDKISSDWAEVYPMLKDWALYEYTRLKDGKAPVLDPSKLDKAKVGGLYGLAMTVASLNGCFEHSLLLERAAQSNKSPIDSAFAKLTLAVIYSHQSNINPPKAERYLSSLAESDSYLAPYANMMLQAVRKGAKKIREKIPKLLNDLKYGDKEKRSRAAFKLARESGPDGVKALHQAQEDPNKYVRYEAACTLARWGRGRSIKPDFNLILEALMDEDAYIREKARGAFSIRSPMKVGPKEITAIVRLMNDHYSKELSWTIKVLLSSVSPEEWKAAMPELIKLLNHENTDVRTTVLDILRRIGPAASDAIPSLIKLLPYEDETRSDYIFAIIGGMGPAAEPFMPEIAKYLDHEDINVRRDATNTLKRISPEKAEQIFKAREKEK